MAQKFISDQEIARLAERFRLVNFGQSFPVDVEQICDILNIDIIAVISLKWRQQIDAFISSNFSKIYVDADELDRGNPRLRFTLAHELGHYALHRDSYPKDLNSIEKILAASALQTSKRAETQANIFASCLLMPEQELTLQLAQEFGETFKKTLWRGTTIEIANSMDKIAKHFGVSKESLLYRICNVFPNLLIPGE